MVGMQDRCTATVVVLHLCQYKPLTHTHSLLAPLSLFRRQSQYMGPSTLTRRFAAEETPLLAKAGAVIPMKLSEGGTSRGDTKRIAPHTLVLAVVWAVPPGPRAVLRGTTTVYEDDGETLNYQQRQQPTQQLGLASTGTATTSISSTAVATHPAYRLTNASVVINASGGVEGGVTSLTSLTVKGGSHVPFLPQTRRFVLRFRNAPNALSTGGSAGMNTGAGEEARGATFCRWGGGRGDGQGDGQGGGGTVGGGGSSGANGSSRGKGGGDSGQSMEDVVWSWEAALPPQNGGTGVPSLVATTGIIPTNSTFVCGFSIRFSV